MASLNGTSGNDTLIGDNVDAFGAGGSDTIRGAAGNDTIDGQGGSNQLFGEDGDDTIRVTITAVPAVRPHSTIDGGPGFDTLDLSGSTTGNTLQAQNGVIWTDFIDSIVGIERIILGDLGFASLGNTSQGLSYVLTGRNTVVRGGTGNDTIVGGPGNDGITFNGGNDIASGGAGQNQFILAAVSGANDHITITGGSERDELVLHATALDGHPTDVDLNLGIATVGATTLHITGVESVLINGSSIVPVVRGDAGANHIQIFAGAFGFTGAGGDLRGGGGNDSVDGGPANDRLSGDEGDDEIYGEGGNDTLIGGQGQDTIGGGLGNNWIDGGDGHDWLFGGASGGPFGFSSGRGSDTIEGGAGNDHIFGNLTITPRVDFDANIGDQGDLIDAGDGGDYVHGNDGADTIMGGTGADRLQGGDGADSLSGGAGPDQINGNRGNDTILGGEGNDFLRGGKDDDLIEAGDGNDILLGDLGNDTLRAGAGIDVLAGGDGADLFDFSEEGAAAINGSGPFSTILDYADGSDLVRLGFAVQAEGVLHDAGNFASVAEAKSVAETLLANHAGVRDVAVLQVGPDSFLFYNAGGQSDIVNATICFSNTGAAAIGISDFG